MSSPIQIGITTNAAAVIRQVENLPPTMAQKIAVAMDQENELTTGAIQAKHLTGAGPFPVEQHRLGVRSNRYRLSLRPSKAVVAGNNIESAIGTNLRGYPRAHEFGFVGTVTVRAHLARHHALDVFNLRGRTVKGYQIPGIGKGDRKTRVAEGFVTIRAHAMKMNIPARAPISTGIQERAPNYRRAVSAAILAAWQQPPAP